MIGEMIARATPMRPKDNVRLRVRFLLSTDKRGKWTEEEKSSLRKAVQTHGTVWPTVALAVGSGRSPRHCRAQWDNSQRDLSSVWSSEDVEALRAAYTEFNGDWLRISAVMGRPPNTLSKKWCVDSRRLKIKLKLISLKGKHHGAAQAF